MDKKKIYTIAGVLVAILAIVIIGFVRQNLNHSSNQKNITIAGASKVESSSSSSSSSTEESDKIDETNGDENYANAVIRLETRDKASDEETEKVKDYLDTVMSATADYKIDDLGGLVSKYFLGQKELVQTFWIMCQVNHYKLDKDNLVVTKSNNDDVVQFIAPFNGVEDAETVYIVGNYSLTRDGIELLVKYGDVKGATYG